MQTKQPPKQDETAVAPMPVQQRGIKLSQNLGHEPRVFLLLFDEEVDGSLVGRIGRARRLLAQMLALAALSHLKALQGTDQRRPQVRGEFDLAFPGNQVAVTAVILKIVEPFL